MSELGMSAAVKFSGYNQVFQTLLDPTGLMSKKTFANAVLIRLEDWIEGDKSTIDPIAWKNRLKPIVGELFTAVRAFVRPSPILVLVCSPSTKISGETGAAAVLNELTTEIVTGLKGIPGVYAFGPQAVASLYPVSDYYDAGADSVGRIPYTAKYFAALGTFLTRMALALRRSPYKAIVLDCDNTLWAGVCGEGGVRAVSVGPGFRAMQEFIAAQSAEGKILCLCSKNIEADVWEIFEHHPDMLLQREQVVGHRINWLPKSENLRELAKELKLGLDSFIFLDDNPVECAEVRLNCPEVLTLQAPAQGEDWPEFLKHVWAFDQLKVTDQDRQRTASYLQNARREAVRKESTGLDDFLERLDLRVDITPPTSAQMARAAQLTERTNQLNLSTIRRNETEILTVVEDFRHRCYVVEVKDRFGDYGLVGLTITRADPKALVIDTMLLSCRVLGRGVEHRMVAFIGERANALGLAEVEIPFVRSKKNQPALDFLNSIAGNYRSETADGFVYRLPADTAAGIKAQAISAPPPEVEKETAGATAIVPTAAVVPYQRIATEFQHADSILAAVNAAPSSLAESLPQDTFIEPQNDRQRQLAKIWCKVLKLPRVGICDDYFALGGTSVLSVRLVLEIEKVFGRLIPIATLLKAPTIQRLADFLEDPAEGDDLAVVALRAEGSLPPLLLMPGIGGHVMKYKRMVDLLDTNQAVYGFEMRPEVEANRTPRSLQQIAGEFIARILKVQPQGPYLLAGWSFGGALAFEIAHQLRAQDKAVGLVALFDTWGHVYPRPVPLRETLCLHAQRFARRTFGQNIRYVAVTARTQILSAWHRTLKLAGVRQTDFYYYESPLTEQMVAVCDAAWCAYRPSRLPGRLVLIRAVRWPDLISLSYNDPYNGWGGLADTIEVHPVDGAHMGLFDEPVVKETAAALSKSLRESLDGSSSPSEISRHRRHCS
jgi:FkbH-like protein